MAHRSMAAKHLLAALVFLLLLGGMRIAEAAESLFATTLRTQVSIVSDTDSVAPGKPFQIALRFVLSPDWHIYWINPGDAGAAPTAVVTLSGGGQAGPIQWPIPRVQQDGPVTTYGYQGDADGQVLLPMTITPPKTAPVGGRFPISVAATWLVCKDICVPGNGTFTLSLPVAATAKPSPQAGLFQDLARHLPRATNWHAWIQPGGQLLVDGTAANARNLKSVYFFPSLPGAINQEFDQTYRLRNGRLAVFLTPVPGFDATKPLAGILVIKTWDGTKTAALITAQPGMPPVIMASSGVIFLSAGFWVTLAAALLGGLILNLMPCVFPILAMKAAHLARTTSHGGDGTVARREGLSYGLGVVVSFALLGALFLALRVGGHLAGWGFQFQSPIFVLGMIWLLFAVGLNFSGFIVISGRWVGLGQGAVARGGPVGSFLTGVLATVVATPCTTPFMGAALAAALAGPPLPGMAIFVALGLGLALPVVVLSLIPGVGRILPRPGRWMEILHQALAFPIYASVLWLVWVAVREGGSPLLLAAGGGMLLVAFAAWLYRLGGRVAPALGVLAVLALVPVLAVSRHAKPDQAHAMAQGAEPFSTARLAALRAAGTPAFVDLTAAWCVTCLVNERVALDRDDVRRGFRSQGVTYLVGDWTREDPDITAFLKAHNRDGVPLYLFYPPKGAEPVMLPQILTPGLVLNIIGAPAG
jgi:thiol:disulfide interchange protein/DsbC/DsbD-like thiol-disulfide interchange protein